MTSLLPIQYVTPHSITSTSASSVGKLTTTSNTEKYQHDHHQFQQRWYNRMTTNTLTTSAEGGALPSVTMVKPRSTPNNSNNRLAYVDALVGKLSFINDLLNLKSKHMWIRCKCSCY